jgi:hypothetical protein
MTTKTAGGEAVDGNAPLGTTIVGRRSTTMPPSPSKKRKTRGVPTSP